MGANVQLFPRSLYQQRQGSTVAHARAPALNLKGSPTWIFFCDHRCVCFDCANNDNSRRSANKPHGG